jgi:hypothetical protein
MVEQRVLQQMARAEARMEATIGRLMREMDDRVRTRMDVIEGKIDSMRLR